MSDAPPPIDRCRLEIRPSTTKEKLVALPLLLLGGCHWAYKIVGTVRKTNAVRRWDEFRGDVESKLRRGAPGKMGMGIHQRWEELPACVQRYLQLTAPKPASNAASVAFQRKGKVSLWYDSDRWLNHTLNGTLGSGGFATNGVTTSENRLWDYRTIDVFWEERGHRFGYQSSLVSTFYSENVEFDFTCFIRGNTIAEQPLLKEWTAIPRDINSLQGKRWLSDAVLFPALLRPEAGARTSGQRHFSTIKKGLMTKLKWTELQNLAWGVAGAKRPYYSLREWACYYEDYRVQELGDACAHVGCSAGIGPHTIMGPNVTEFDGFVATSEFEQVALEYNFND
ncbi:hypothetical protein ACHAXT_005131 [Thalassiosira profunda]